MLTFTFIISINISIQIYYIMLTSVWEPGSGRLYLDLAAAKGLVVTHSGGGQVWVHIRYVLYTIYYILQYNIK